MHMSFFSSSIPEALGNYLRRYAFFGLAELAHWLDRRNSWIDTGFGKSSIPLTSFFPFRRIYFISAVLIVSDFLSCAVYLL